MDGCCLIWVTSLALAIFGLVKSDKALACNHDEVIIVGLFPLFSLVRVLFPLDKKIVLYWS
ncbi:uncharacterized protein RHIMIDRAFT_282728 [Rhizopus microsporus ATCC 52813]|uniref:Uncharacterized protein n=1 Tax=Rhizopus microsporus ATCC 52813 TaxID=1340429 RepID=A0A2G4SV15_RHIZD|nr:uncharacterized protein RHIMIDRAFT_282728 [Rhizopus microsporus ATCC 52813]PHZ12611.1 hypothetical protein RHIMIDRAFT_282728 [Rhizopus microsporus ATCC 52813]